MRGPTGCPKSIAAYLESEACFSDLCLDCGVRRKTGYKWVRRYEAMGALEDISRAPHAHPNAVVADVLQVIVAIRRRHARWGPRKVRVVLKRDGHATCSQHDRRHPEAQWTGPYASAGPAARPT